MLNVAGKVGCCYFVATAGQVDGFLEQAAQGFELLLFPGRHGVAEFFATPEQMAVAAALGDVENVVTFQSIDDEIAVEVGTEDVLRHAMSAGTLAGADDIDGGLFAAEDPQPALSRPTRQPVSSAWTT